MFDVMPMWTDVIGAALVLITVITITFEKRIVKMQPACCAKAKPDGKDAEKNDEEKNDDAIKNDIIKELSGEKLEKS